MKDSLLTIWNMEKVSISRRPEIYTKETSTKEKFRVRGCSNTVLEINTLASLWVAWSKVKAFTNMQVVQSMMESGGTISSMEKVYTNMQMAMSIMETGLMIKRKGMVFWNSVSLCMKAHSNKEDHTGEENSPAKAVG